MTTPPDDRGGQPSLAHDSAVLHAILDSVLDAVITIDEDARVLSFNRAAEAMFGRSPAEVLGQNVKMLMAPPYRHEHDAYLRRYLETGEASIIGRRREVVGMRRDGTIFPVLLGVSEAHADGRRLFVGIIHDLTEANRVSQAHHETEARFQAIVDLAFNGFVTIDVSGCIETFNKAAERIFGYRFEEVFRRNVAMLMPSPFREEHNQYILSYLHGGEPRIIGKGREVVGRRKSGDIFPMFLGVSEVNLGQRLVFAAVIRDLSDDAAGEPRP